MKKNIFNNLYVLSLIATLLVPLHLVSQESRVISGVLLDDSNAPVKGVVLSSSIESIVTDINGQYSLKVSAVGDDRIIIEQDGYKLKIVDVLEGVEAEREIILPKLRKIDENRIVSLPFLDMESYRSVSSSYILYGNDLTSYPTTTILEALAGRVPGLIVHRNNSQPGFESVSASIRGVGALTYVDGILRDVSDLLINEVEKIEIIKDFSGRSVLGIVAGNPIINITTKSGSSHKTKVTFTGQFGFRNPLILPKYLDSYNYASLFNEARINDGRDPFYTSEKLEGFKEGVNSLRFPNINYYDRFVKSSTPFTNASIYASGGDKRVQYFTILDYIGSRGLESVGQISSMDRYKLRANIDLKLTDIISMNVNLSGTYGQSKYPNEGNGPDTYDMFDRVLSFYPSNAHPLEYDSMLFISDNYPINLINELKYGGYAKRVDLNTQNSTTLKLDLGSFLKGLSLIGKVAFDVNNSITNNKGGSEALYRHTLIDGEDHFERVREKEVVTSLYSGADFFLRRTTFNGLVNYDRQINKNELTLNLIYAQMLEDVKVQSPSYQPRKTQDISFRANYAYDKKYVLQGELNYSGIMKLAPKKRFNLFSTIGAGWVLSNEDFLKDHESINYLKLYSTFGVMGIDNFYIPSYNQFYLHETLWANNGIWRPGIEGNYADYVNIYGIVQQGSNSYEIPKRNHLNIGIESLFLRKRLSATMNYFYIRDYDLISLMESRVPSLFGTGGFLPATNYGKNNRWGIDGALNYSTNLGEFDLSFGVNAVYLRGKYLEVDEPLALDDYRKLAGKYTDLIWGFETNGLFQTESEVSSYGINTSWGKVHPGDIKYVDYNNDNLIDSKDIHPLKAHYPRINYGLNFSVAYNGLKLFIVGTGVADGNVMLNNSRYFWINNENQNFSEPMLDRWPKSDNYPRLTTFSPHNYQSSSYWLRKAAYLNLSNVELSYALPRKISLSFLMKDLKMFIRGANLLNISSLNSYGVNASDLNSGINKYPQMRTVVFGFSAKF